MNWDTVWQFLNSTPGIAFMAGLLSMFVKWLFVARPGWEAWEGTLIAAVKFAEKEIPDDAKDKSMRRLDAALRYVIEVYTEAMGKAPSRAVGLSLVEGIQIVHADREGLKQ